MEALQEAWGCHAVCKHSSWVHPGSVTAPALLLAMLLLHNFEGGATGCSWSWRRSCGHC